ncbi:MAG TPA: AAA family ATPase [Flavisolibacter sp.]|nr:AAA family ATPase [Flavisolibacter sp.]
MKLKSFRITNYKSIIDSGECRLLENDNITVLAGQNESGKSSILQALRDYHKNGISEEVRRLEEDFPSIKCTYLFEKGDKEAIIDSLRAKLNLPQSFEAYIIKMQEFTLTKTFKENNSATFDLEEGVFETLDQIRESEVVRLTNAKSDDAQLPDLKISEKDTIDEEKDDEDDEEKLEDSEESSKEEVDVTSKNFVWEIAFEIDYHLPTVIFFDDFCDLLPDKILISDLINSKEAANGYQAVKNIETILNENFTRLDTLGDALRHKAQSKYEKTITAKFNEKWTQKISEDDQAKIYIQYNQGKSTNGSYLNFFIETRDGELLAPKQRSQGFRWFLSFYLQLKAESERSKSLVILFDEPGLFLHSRAQNDMIKVFEELAEKNQIIYSTHSPYLIDTSKLHRIKLIINNKKYGTTIEKITTNKVTNPKDSLKPIVDAMGLEVANNFSTTKKRNVILEGISDMYYLEAFKKLLSVKGDYSFIPAMGAPNVHLLMELCIGWGLEWLIVFDEKGVNKEYNKIKKYFFNNSEEETSKKILKLNGFEGIEDLFDDADLKNLISTNTIQKGQSKSDFVMENGGKELVARLFLEKVQTNTLKRGELSDQTKRNFESIFQFIQEKFAI